ncbi:dienelactone hydrolase family protein [Nakamurella endophytica]|uniref:Carboxymethylenebutenolidase n=1 Tax=Nakamurella endophytica TaxID=1748367 RepID=A0A917SPI5_9ACTN|nr:dienelactone hydrolase family protein [Nakamurella endophytica]GGL89919.1 carboxymethylenebutenolidase [Nakamurella endophytica]
MITLPGAGHSAYLATPPATAAPWPAVVVVHDLFGLGDDMRSQADWLAGAGYLAVVPDLFGGRAPIRCMQGAFRQLAAQRGPMFEEIDAARRWVADRDDCTGAVGIIGFCMGGGFALLMAGRPGWAVASVNYGQLPKNLEEVLSDPCPIVASYGGRDRSLPGAAGRLGRVLEHRDGEFDVKEYPQAGHGFMNRLTAASPLTPLLKVFGVSYDPEATADARSRILAFFAAQLHPGGAAAR